MRARRWTCLVRFCSITFASLGLIVGCGKSEPTTTQSNSPPKEVATTPAHSAPQATASKVPEKAAEDPDKVAAESDASQAAKSQATKPFESPQGERTGMQEVAASPAKPATPATTQATGVANPVPSAVVVSRKADVVVPTADFRSVEALLFSVDSTQLLVGNTNNGRDGRVSVWIMKEAKKGEDLISERLHYASVLALSPDGKVLAMGGVGQMTLNDAATGKNISALSEGGSAVAFSADSKTFLSPGGDLDGKIRVWEVSDPAVDPGKATPVTKLRKTLKQHSANVTCFAWARDGKTFASGSADKVIKIWDAASYEVLATLEGHTASVQAVAYSPDCKTLVSAGADKTVRFWDLAMWKQMAVGQGHEQSVTWVAFHHDGKLVASAGWDGRILLWDAVSQQQIAVLPLAQQYARSLAFSPDGRFLAAFSASVESLLCIDPNIEIWDMTQAPLPASGPSPGAGTPATTRAAGPWAKADYLTLELTVPKIKEHMQTVAPERLPPADGKDFGHKSKEYTYAFLDGLTFSSLGNDGAGGLVATIHIPRVAANAWPQDGVPLETFALWGRVIVDKMLCDYNLQLSGTGGADGVIAGKITGTLGDNAFKFQEAPCKVSPRRYKP